MAWDVEEWTCDHLPRKSGLLCYRLRLENIAVVLYARTGLKQWGLLRSTVVTNLIGPRSWGTGALDNSEIDIK